MNKPKLSILIAAYNAEKYLDECIGSILNQKYNNYEVIIINDGSTDSTHDICMKYAAKSDKLNVFTWENHGLVLSRRKAISLAKGDYILFLDADDAYKEDAFETIAMDLEKNIDVIIYRFEFLYENGVSKESRRLCTNSYLEQDKYELFRDFISNYEYNHMWSKVMKRELLLSDPYEYSTLKDIKLGEDLLQSIYIYGNARSVLVSDKIIYSYRVLSSSMSHGFNCKHISDIARVYNCLYEYIQYADWNQGIDCYEALNESFSIKMAGLLRELWLSEERFGEKKRMSGLIISVNRNMVNTKKIVWQNRILWKLANKGYWRKCKAYSSVIKNMSDIRRLIRL